MWQAMPDRRALVLAFDYGLKFTGVAIGEISTGMCRPLDTLLTSTRAARWQAVDDLLKTWEPSALVVGLPLDAEGFEQESTRQSRNFARQLARRSGLPTHMVDERYTSLEARQNLRHQGKTHSECSEEEHAEAAALVLRTYLESCPS